MNWKEVKKYIVQKFSVEFLIEEEQNILKEMLLYVIEQKQNTVTDM